MESPHIPSKVMLIDDSETEYIIFNYALKELNLSLEFLNAINGEEALRQLSDHSDHLPGLIFLDLNIPKLDGYQVLEKLKSSVQLQNIPVVIYTSMMREPDLVKIKALGANWFFEKPYSLNLLLQTLQYLFDHYRSAEAHKVPPDLGTGLKHLNPVKN